MAYWRCLGDFDPLAEELMRRLAEVFWKFHQIIGAATLLRIRVRVRIPVGVRGRVRVKAFLSTHGSFFEDETGDSVDVSLCGLRG